MRGVVVLVCATILLLFAMAIPWQPLFQVALALYALAGLCLLWIVASVWGLRFLRPQPVRRGQVGRPIHDAFHVANRSFLPKIGLELRDHSTLPGHHADTVLSLGPRQEMDGAAETVSELRGLYTLGPTGAAAVDPFGLFRLELPVGPASDLLVYPETVPLDNFSVPGSLPLEGSRRRRRTQQLTHDPAGARPYVYGDSMRRIHWQSTAHTGQLMVKEYELTPAADVWLFVDLEGACQAGEGVHSTEEYAVTAAASIAAHYLQAGREVGIVTSGRGREVLDADRGERQLVRALELLAVVHANGRTPLHEVLWTSRPRLRRSSTVLAISPSTDERWAGVLAQLQQAGTRTAAVLVEAATFGGPRAATMQFASLTSAGVPTFLVKRSATIRTALHEGLLGVREPGALNQ